MSEWKKKLLLTCASLVFALILGEVAVRLFEKAPDEVVVSDPVLKYRTLQGVDIDARGLRNREALATATIVVFGDSMTAGNGVTREEAWPHVLETLSTTSVYSYAVSGYGPVQYLSQSDASLSLHPSFALVGLYTGNDLYDAYDLAYHFDEWKGLRDPGFTATETPLIDADVRTQVLAGAPKGTLSYTLFTLRLWLREHVHLYALVGNATRELRERSGVAQTETQKLADVSTMNMGDSSLAYVYDQEPELRTILSPVYRRDVVDLSVPTTKEGLRITRDCLRAMRERFAKGGGVRMVLVIIPTKELAYTLFMDKRGESYPEALRVYRDKELAMIEAVKSIAKNDFAVIDVTGGYVDALNAHQPIFKPVMDGHPNALGYRVIAETVMRELYSATPQK
jgi:hypothetical protein